MPEPRRWAAMALCTVLFGAGALSAGGALLCLPGRSWLMQAALLTQDPATALHILADPAVQAAANRRPERPDRPSATRPTPQPSATPSPTAEPTATPEPSPSPSPLPSAAPKISNAGRIRSVQLEQGSGTGYVQLNAGSIKNMTEYPDSDLRAAATTQNLPFAVERGSSEPQVLILHTHATESYQTWPDLIFDPAYTARSKNSSLNMCAVGKAMAHVLNDAGINTIHDETLHDAAGYTGSYDRSRAAALDYLEKYPSLKVILDVHRDAIEDSDGTRVKPLCQINGEDTAQVMIISGCSNGSSIVLPDWKLNLRFAAAWEQAMEQQFPGLTRPVLCGYRFYNQDLTTGSLLIEIGGHANTLDEAIRAGTYAAEALAGVLCP